MERWEPLAEAMLHAAARRDHLLHTIEPALERGLWVISDRFVDSMIVYQGYGQGADLDVMERLSDLSLGGFEPDLTVVLDIPVAEGLRRAGARAGSNRYERMGTDFHERVRRGLPRPRPEADAGSVTRWWTRRRIRHGRPRDPKRSWRRAFRSRSMSESADSAFAWPGPRENPHLVGHEAPPLRWWRRGAAGGSPTPG